MIIGQLLLKRIGITLNQLIHKNFEHTKVYFEQNKETLFAEANQILITALNRLYNEDYTNLNMERLSAAFRRGELYTSISYK